MSSKATVIDRCLYEFESIPERARKAYFYAAQRSGAIPLNPEKALQEYTEWTSKSGKTYDWELAEYLKIAERLQWSRKDTERGFAGLVEDRVHKCIISVLYAHRLLDYAGYPMVREEVA